LSVADAGIDTAKVSSYVAHDRSIRAMLEGQPTRNAGGGAVLVLGDDGSKDWPVAGARTLFYPRFSLLAVEGHPSGARGALAAPDDVPGWCEDLRTAFADRGVTVDDRLGAARLDAAVTIRTEPRDGAAILSGVAAIVPPRVKLETFRDRDAIETVYYVTEKGRKLARCYDSGHHYGTAERLSTIRFEDQRTYDRPSRRFDVRTVTTANVREAFRDRWGALAKATEGVSVSSVPVTVDRLGVMYETGAVTWAQAERAVGATLLLRSGCRPHDKTLQRRRRELRELGVVLLEGELEPVDVHLGEVLERVCDEAVW